MKNNYLFFLLIALILGACVKENRPSYKKNDLFYEFDAQQGFVIMNLPPILFKIIINSNDTGDFNQKELLDRIDVIKVLVFEENNESIKLTELKNNLNQKISKLNYNLLTQITEDKKQVSVLVKDDNQTINELLFLIVSDKNMFCVNCVGKFKKEDALKLYKSLNTKSLEVSNN